MSGGHFNYDQYRLSDHAEEILKEINNNNKEYDWEKDEWIERENWENHKPETIDEFKMGYMYLKYAELYMQRIDWYLSGDDGEDSFHRRLLADIGDMVDHLNEVFHIDNTVLPF